MVAGVRAIFGPGRRFWPRSQASRRYGRLEPASRGARAIHADAACACTWNGNENLERSHECLVCTWGICGAFLKYLCLYRLVCGHALQVRCQSCIGTAQWGGARLQIRMHVSWNGNGNVERIENTLQWWAEHAAVVHPQSPCAMGVMAINSYNNNWSHDSDSLLEMTPVISGPQMLMYGLTHPNLSTGKESQMTSPRKRRPI